MHYSFFIRTTFILFFWINNTIKPMQPGSLDTSFNPSGCIPGLFTNSVGGNLDEAVGVAVQSDGKIVASGFGRVAGIEEFAVARYTVNGQLDTSFNATGIVLETTVTLPVGNSYSYDVAIQQDGKIVAAGFSTPSTNQFTIVRYTTAGARDLTFGVGGAVVMSNFFVGGNDVIFGLALQQDGKIVVGGVASVSNTNFGFGLARFNTDGSPDLTFGGTGRVYVPFGSPSSAEIEDIVLQPNGKIVVTGIYSNPMTLFDDAVVARFNTDGSLDNSFGTGGIVITSIPNSSALPIAVALQRDGSIIIAGQIFDSVAGIGPIFTANHGLQGSNVGNVFVARYTCDGILDTTFGNNGIIIMSVGIGASLANDVIVQPNGKIMIVGEAQQPTTVILLIAYNPDGSLDTSFNPLAPNPGETPGIVLTKASSQDVGNSIAITPDMKLAIAGFSALQTPACVNGQTNFIVGRYFADNFQMPMSALSQAILDKYCTACP